MRSTNARKIRGDEFRCGERDYAGKQPDERIHSLGKCGTIHRANQRTCSGGQWNGRDYAQPECQTRRLNRPSNVSAFAFPVCDAGEEHGGGCARYDPNELR
jgi:hypothetical protein